MRRCLDGYPHHFWKKAGLDVIHGELRRVRRCGTCGAERTEAYR